MNPLSILPVLLLAVVTGSAVCSELNIALYEIHADAQADEKMIAGISE